MSEINAQELLKAMLSAMEGVFDDRWPQVQAFARVESKAFVANMAEIEEMKYSGEISIDQATTLTKMHRNSMEAVMTAVEGVGLAMAEQAVNAAIAAVRQQINAAIGWTLL